jgi:hypothetical protein
MVAPNNLISDMDALYCLYSVSLPALYLSLGCDHCVLFYQFYGSTLMVLGTSTSVLQLQRTMIIPVQRYYLLVECTEVINLLTGITTVVPVRGLYYY